MKALIVGCGLKPKAGCVNLDRVKLPGVDVVYDLDNITQHDEWLVHPLLRTKTPDERGFLPFLSEEFDRVECSDVLEHVADPIAVVQEIGRILKVGGKLWIRGPDCDYPQIVWADLTHKRAFSERTFDGFCVGTEDHKLYGYYHGPIKFSIIERATKRNMGLEWTLQRR